MEFYNYIDGDPGRVRGGLAAISESFQTNDLSIVTITYAFVDRVRSYELVAEACGLAFQGRPDRG